MPTIMLCLLISTLIALCHAANNNSGGKTNPNMGTQQFPSHGPCGSGACFCAPGIPGMPENPGPSGPGGIAGSPGPQGSTGPRGNKGDAGKPGREGPLGPKGPSGTFGPKGNTGPKGAKGYAGNKGSQGLPGPKGPQGTTGKAGPRGTKGDAGNTGPPGPKGTPGPLESNWKQCIWKNIDDGKDTGLIKECVFKKKSENTGLRVFWNGNLRLYDCHDCCRRWYFTFNGTECSAPAAIDGIVYMVLGNGAKKNLHRVRQIEGVCEKVHKGTVRVGFWVGNCARYGSANAFTGWNSVSRIYVEEVQPHRLEKADSQALFVGGLELN